MRPPPPVVAVSVVTVALLPMLSLVSSAWAQDTTPYRSTTESPRLFDADRAGTLKGTVVSIDTMKPSAESSDFVQVELKVGSDVVTVHLGPQWFMDEQIHRIELEKGVELEVKGTPQTVEGKRVFVASEIKRPEAEQRLRLRHQDGSPVWNASERAS